MARIRYFAIFDGPNSFYMRGFWLSLVFLMAWLPGLAQMPALDSLPNCTPVPGYRHRPTTDYYSRAYDTIQAMVDGRLPLDFQKAVFLTEWAYLDGRMNPALFNAAIDRAAHFCQLLARQHGADTAKNPQLYYNWAAYNWVSDTVRVVVEGDTVERMPYRYDFNDYEGRAEWDNTFVSKLLATGSGTCRSMPYLYKMLCDKLGAKSWLALAPQHVYVKHTNGDPNYPVLYNVETTSGSFPTDGWIMASSYVTLEGILSSMYMDSLTQRVAVALTLVDLAKGWQRRFGDRGPVDEDHFALKCAEACLAAHPEPGWSATRWRWRRRTWPWPPTATARCPPRCTATGWRACAPTGASCCAATFRARSTRRRSSAIQAERRWLRCRTVVFANSMTATPSFGWAAC